MSDLLATSAQTWRDPDATPGLDAASNPEPNPALDPALAPPGPRASARERLAALKARHRARRRWAEEIYAASRSPERGWPVAGEREVLGFVAALVRRRAGTFAALVALNAIAAAAALTVPRLLGELVDQVTLSGPDGRIGTVALVAALVVVAQAAATFAGQVTSTVFGQGLLATMREYVVATILRLPLSRVESSSTGDLVTRVTRDVATMSRAVQYGLPMLVTTSLTALLSVVAMLLNSVLLAVPALLVAGSSVVSVRRYLRRAAIAYVAEGASYSLINTTLAETVEGTRTVEALRLDERRLRALDHDLAVSGQAERYGMTLRNLLFSVMDVAFNAPRVVTLAVGAWGYWEGWVSLGQITTAVLYVEALAGPLDRLVSEIDHLQVGAASTARLLGIASVPPDREAGDAVPSGVELVGEDLRFAYRPGHDVLHGVDFRPRPGERLAVVGPSGSGKSTLARLLAGVNGPRTGSVRVGGVEVMTLPLERLREDVALVTQEHHVFLGSLRDNILLGRPASDDEAVWRALEAVGSAAWVRRLPAGLDTEVGSGSLALTPAQAQQVAMARLVVADPHTLVLDEATSLIDPQTARTLEGSVHALLEGRTVVAVAHRLHTAHDADRIAVVVDGRVVELGTHDELVARDGEYAALWRVWTS